MPENFPIFNVYHVRNVQSENQANIYEKLEKNMPTYCYKVKTVFATSAEL